MENSDEKTDLREKKSLHNRLWASRSHMEKRLLIISVCFLVIFLVVLVMYLILLRKPEICTDSACLETSMNLLNQIDVHQNPCYDFYKFSCGNFMKNTNLERVSSRSAPDIMKEEIQLRIKNILEQPVRSEQPKYLNLAKQFYRACMNESAIESEGLKWMKQIFRRIGGWPTLEGDNWKEEDFDWKEAVHKLRTMGISFDFFMSFSLVSDKKSPAKYVLQLNDPYKDHSQPINEEVKKIYLRYMEDVAVYFGSSHVNARIDQKDVLDFTLQLAEKSEEGKRTNMSGLYNPYLLSELQYKFSSISWDEFINGILSPSAKLDYGDEILVPDPFYLMEFEKLMMNTTKRVQANFMAWHTLQMFITFMPEELANKAYEYVEALNGRTLRKQRWHMCVNAVKERMGPIVSSAYIEEYFDEEMRIDATSIIHDIKAQHQKALEKFDWIDEQTKKTMRVKLLDNAADVVSYSEISSLLQICSEYNEVTIYHDNLLLSVMNLDQFALNLTYKKLGQLVRINWLENPNFVTGLEISTTTPSSNILVLPVGILNSIYYAKDRPKFLKYGGFGSAVSKKLWQTFTATKYNEIGGARSWWTPASLLNYEERLKCLGEVFGRFGSMRNREYRVSKATEDDLGLLIGVKIAYDTYVNFIDENGEDPQLPGINFTQKQLFWIYFSKPFCAKYASFPTSSESIKLNGIISNFREFSNDFDCAATDLMNLEEQCNIF